MHPLALLRHSGEECHFSEIVGIVATLDLLRADELVNVLHGDDGGLAVEIEDKELAALLVCELLSLLDGMLLSDVEEPIFEENDNFFPYFVCYLKINVYFCSVFNDYPLSMRGGYEPYRHAPEAILRWLFLGSGAEVRG